MANIELQSEEEVKLFANDREVNRVAAMVNREHVAPLLHQFLIKNFEKGGHAPNSRLTLASKSMLGLGNKPLVGTGKLANRAIYDPVIRASANGVEILPRRPDARMSASMGALHDGASITIFKTPRMRRFFWAMYYRFLSAGLMDVAEVFKRGALSAKPTVSVTIPPRPWTELTPAQERMVSQMFDTMFEKEMQLRVWAYRRKQLRTSGSIQAGMQTVRRRR